MRLIVALLCCCSLLWPQNMVIVRPMKRAVDGGGGGSNSFTAGTPQGTVCLSFTSTCVVSVTATAGQLLVGWFYWSNSTATVSVTGGGTWVCQSGDVFHGTGALNGVSGKMCWVLATSGGTFDVTQTLSQSVNVRAINIVPYSYTGTASTDGTDVINQFTASGTDISFSGPTTTVSNTLVAGGCVASESTTTAGSGFTNRDAGQGFVDGGGMQVDKIGASTGAQTILMTAGGSGESAICGAVAFKAT